MPPPSRNRSARKTHPPPADPPAPEKGAGRRPALLLPIVLIAAAALLLRLWGIGWALPNATRYFSYHVDESMVVIHSLVVNPFLLLLDPGFYNYPSGAFLVNSVFLHLAGWAGLIGPGPAQGIPSAGALLVARLVTAFMGTLTCVFIYGVGRLLYHRTAGLAGAGLYAVAPLAVQHGHFATVDVPATFWIVGSLYFAARHLSAQERRPHDLFWCGLWAGFAAGTKYNAGLVLLAGVAAWWIARPHPPTPSPNSPGFAGGRGGVEESLPSREVEDDNAAGTPLPPAKPGLLGEGSGVRAGAFLPILLFVGAIAGFILFCPAILLNPAGVMGGIAEESRHVREGHGIAFTNTAPGLVYHIAFNLRWGLGWPLLLVALAGWGYALYRRRPGDWILLAFVLPYYLLIGVAQVKFSRYTLPLFPPLLLYAGGLLPDAIGSGDARRKWLVTAPLGAAAAYALLFSLAIDNTMRGLDPRDEAAAFIRQRGLSPVGFAKGPWFFSPPLGPLLTHPVPAVAQQSAFSLETPRLIPSVSPETGGPVEWNVSLLESNSPAAVALSEFEYEDAERINHPPAMEYLSALRQKYSQRQVFAKPMQVLGLRFTNLNDGDGQRLSAQGLPEDMRYTNPTTIVFTR